MSKEVNRTMKVTKVCDTSCFQNPHGVDAKEIYKSENAQVIHMALAKDQTLKKHVTPVDVFFYILEGKGFVEIGEETQEVEKDTIVESPKGIPHLLRNNGDSFFRFLVVKLPKSK